MENARATFKTDIPDTIREMGRKGGYPQPIDMQSETTEADALLSDESPSEGLPSGLGCTALQDPEA